MNSQQDPSNVFMLVRRKLTCHHLVCLYLCLVFGLIAFGAVRA